MYAVAALFEFESWSLEQVLRIPHFICSCVKYRAFSHKSRFKIATLWRIVIVIFELPSVHTREKTLHSLQFCTPEWGEKAWLVFVFFWHADCYSFVIELLLEKVRFLGGTWKWLGGQVEPSPKSKFRGQGIHMAILLRNLRDTSLETPADEHFNFAIEISCRDSNVHTHGPN